MRANKWLGLLLVLTLIVGLAAAPVLAAPGKGNSANRGRAGGPDEYEDLDQAQWADACIAEVSAKGYMKGTGPARFGPHAAMTRAMALAAVVRTPALSGAPSTAQVNAAARRIRDWQQVPEWARSSVALALAHDLVPEADGNSAFDLNPNRNATRLWAVQVLMRAMGLGPVATPDGLPFKDARQIPQELWGWVAAAYQHGIIVGEGDRTFQPHKPLSRAEMAQLFCNADEYERNRGKARRDEVVGIIYTVTIATNQNPVNAITVQTGPSTYTPVTLADSFRVYLDGLQSQLSQLVPGMDVTIILNADDLGVVVRARSEAAEVPDTVYSGVVTRVRAATGRYDASITIRLADAQTRTIALDSDVVLTDEDDDAITLDQIHVGDTVEVTVSGGVATLVHVISPAGTTPPPGSHSVTGKISAVEVPTTTTLGTITFTSDAGVTREYIVASGASMVRESGPAITWADLIDAVSDGAATGGAPAGLALSGNVVVGITLLEP